MSIIKENLHGTIDLAVAVKTADGVLAKGDKVKISASDEIAKVDTAGDNVFGYVIVANKEAGGKATVVTRGKKVSAETTGAAYSAGDLLGVDSQGRFIRASQSHASGTITIVDNTWQGTETITVNGTVLTVVTDFSLGGDVNATALAIATAINNKVAGVKATAAAAVITVTALDSGTVGNTITLATNDASNADIAVSGALLTGGMDFYPVAQAIQASTGSGQSKTVLWF